MPLDLPSHLAFRLTPVEPLMYESYPSVTVQQVACRHRWNLNVAHQSVLLIERRGECWFELGDEGPKSRRAVVDALRDDNESSSRIGLLQSGICRKRRLA